VGAAELIETAQAVEALKTMREFLDEDQFLAAMKAVRFRARELVANNYLVVFDNMHFDRMLTPDNVSAELHALTQNRWEWEHVHIVNWLKTEPHAGQAGVFINKDKEQLVLFRRSML
jgi:hypothetical protein